MQYTSLNANPANRFASIEEVSDQIFQEIIPKADPETPCRIDESRVRTRLLNLSFLMSGVAKNHFGLGHHNALNQDAHAQDQDTQPDDADLTFGWLVIVDGPGRGKSFSVSKEITTVGRGTDQDICLNFGDHYVSRRAHITIHFEEDRGLVAVRCGEKQNPVMLNGRPFSGTRLLKHKSCIRVGQTTLRFVAIDDQSSFWSA